MYRNNIQRLNPLTLARVLWRTLQSKQGIQCKPVTYYEGIRTMDILELKAKHGYYRTDFYPIGGDFHRTPGPMRIKVIRHFDWFQGCDIEGYNNAGEKVACSSRNCIPYGVKVCCK